MIRLFRYLLPRFTRSLLPCCVLASACAWGLGTVAVHAGEEVEAVVESVVLRPLQEAEVPARRTGLLQKVVVAEGEHVKKGKLLATLDIRAAVLERDQAKLEVAGAEAKAANQVQRLYAEKALEVAQAELRRSEESNQKFARSISQSQLDVERLTVEKLTLERQQAEHEKVLEQFELQVKQSLLEASEWNLQQHAVRAPFSGTVVLVRGRVGEWMELGAPVLRLVSVSTLRAEGFLPAEVARREWVGREVQFETMSADGNKNTFKGKLRFVSPEMEPVTRQVRVWAEINNPDSRLRPGQQGSFKIIAPAANP